MTTQEEAVRGTNGWCQLAKAEPLPPLHSSKLTVEFCSEMCVPVGC